MSSVFVPLSLRFYLWGLALLLSLILPLLYTFSLEKNNPQVQAQIDIVSAVSPSLVERFGLFTTIVLGEVVVGVVNGAIEHYHLSWLVGIAAILGALVAIGLWWCILIPFLTYCRARVLRWSRSGSTCTCL